MLPKINQKIALTVLNGPFASAYSTYVEDVADQEVTVVRPAVGGVLLPLSVGDQVGVEYAENGKAQLSFRGVIAGFAIRHLPVVTIASPGFAAFRRAQRRDHVRLDVTVPATYAVAYLPGGVSQPSIWISSHTRDLSGNGAQIRCTQTYPEGTLLQLALNLGRQTVNAQAMVVREVQVLETGERWTSIAFTQMKERDREQIVRFIFSVQRERSKLGQP